MLLRVLLSLHNTLPFKLLRSNTTKNPIAMPRAVGFSWVSRAVPVKNHDNALSPQIHTRIKTRLLAVRNHEPHIRRSRCSNVWLHSSADSK